MKKDDTEDVAAGLVKSLPGVAVETMSSKGTIVLTVFDDYADHAFTYLVNHRRILLDRYERDDDDVRAYFYLIVLPPDKPFQNLQATQFSELSYETIVNTLRRKSTREIRFSGRTIK